MSGELKTRTLFFVCLTALIGLLLLPCAEDLAWAKKPTKPTPTPTSPPDPKIAYVLHHYMPKGNCWLFSVIVMDADGRNNRVVYDCGTNLCWGTEWSRDGTQIVFVGNMGDIDQGSTAAIYTVNVYEPDPDFTKLVELSIPDPSLASPTWSPVRFGGQEWIVYADQDPETNNFADLFAVSVGGGDPVQLTSNEDHTLTEPTFSPDGHFLGVRYMYENYSGASHIRVLKIEEVAGQPKIFPEGSSYLLIDDLPCPVFRPDWHMTDVGTYWLMVEACSKAWIFDLGFLYPELIPNPDDPNMPGSIEPVSCSDQTSHLENKDGSMPYEVFIPRFSADGSRFVFYGAGRTIRSIGVLTTNSTDEPIWIWNNRSWRKSPWDLAWSPVD